VAHAVSGDRRRHETPLPREPGVEAEGHFPAGSDPLRADRQRLSADWGGWGGGGGGGGGGLKIRVRTGKGTGSPSLVIEKARKGGGRELS